MNKYSSYRKFTTLVALLLTLVISTMTSAQANQTEAQINALINEFEKKRAQYHIPGMALAVVKNDKIILSHGFGVMDLKNKQPVSAETLFAIGSSSKSFTATLIAMMVDAGKLNWDDQVSDFLPAYRFTVDDEPLPITLKDMLSHRTGYTRNDLLWANGQASSAQILKTAPAAEPWDEFRKNFHYNNVMYLAAGEVTATVASSNWHQLLNEKLLQPLNMKQTFSVHEEALANQHIASGYQWNDATKTNELMPRRNLNNIAPAGGIYSNVNDMTQWLRLLLNKGNWAGQQLVSEKQLLATWEPAIQIGGDINYGMGWFLRQWQGKQVIEHGGNIDGYGAQVAMLPEENIGFVLLTNHTTTPLQQESMNIVWDHLAPQVETTQNKGINYQDFVGEYTANFASFKDTTFTFLVNEKGVPAIDVPGQIVYELKDPDADGKWYFKMTDTIAISFDRATNNSINALRMHQNGMDFELPPKGAEIQPEIELSQLQPYLGEYHSKQFNGPIKVIIQNNRLTLDVPNQMAFELHVPDENNHREFRIKSDMSAVFEKDDKNQISQLILYKDKNKIVDSAPKSKAVVATPLPSVAEVMTLMQATARGQTLSQKGGFKFTGQINMVNSGIKGKVTMEFEAENNYRQYMDFGEFGEITVAASATQAATKGINPYTNFKGVYLKQAQLEHPSFSMNLAKAADTIKVTGTAEVNGRKAYALNVKVEELPARIYYIDAKNGDILRMKAKLLNPSIGSIPVTINYSKFEEHHGLRMAMKAVISNSMMGLSEITYNKVKANLKFKPPHFEIKP